MQVNNGTMQVNNGTMQVNNGTMQVPVCLSKELVHLLYLKPTHALFFCKIHSHSHLTLQTVKNVCETHNLKKPYMFRS